MKWIVNFMKTGRMAFISHLDLQRALLRSLRMAGLQPAYSKGFNPHPKLSLALPLSLGFESLCEYLEVETLRDVDTRAATDALNAHLPDGITVVHVSVKDERSGDDPVAVRSRKALAARVRQVVYVCATPRFEDAEASLQAWLSRATLPCEKEDRKKGGTVTIDIKPMISSFEIFKQAGDNLLFRCTLAAGAGASLNPNLLLKSFYDYSGQSLDAADIRVTRSDIIFI
jgi:radical SAM-linked protein